MRISRTRLMVALLLLGSALALHGDVGPQARYVRLGQQLICTCGCGQSALTCNHLGCPVVTKMQAEIHQRAASADSDELVLESFVQEYGTQVLANPTTKGFNLVAWVMPWVALGLGLALVLYFVKRWRQRQPAVAAGPPDPDLQAQIQAEIQAALDAEFKH